MPKQDKFESVKLLTEALSQAIAEYKAELEEIRKEYRTSGVVSTMVATNMMRISVLESHLKFIITGHATLMDDIEEYDRLFSHSKNTSAELTGYKREAHPGDSG